MIRVPAFLISTWFLLTYSAVALGDSYGPIDVIAPTEKKELWLNPGLYSYHFDRNQDFNSFNYGFGVEYRFSSIASVTAGTYRNSYYNTSNYIGAYWQPIALGPINMGFVLGGFNGYSNTNNGGWFPAVLPAFTIEGKRIGLNLLVIPTVADRISGSLSLQLKFKAFD